MKKKPIRIWLGIFMLTALIGVRGYAEENSYTWMLTGTEKVANNPGLIHFTWEICQPPYGPYDTITLHRVCHENHILEKPVQYNGKAILFLPGTWNAGGWSSITDPAVNPWLYLAAHEYDVYVIDFRSTNLPDMDYDQYAGNGIEIAATADWTYGMYREDIKTCVEKIKELANENKIFLGGFSRGGTYMYMYASQYPGDLKGLVSLDGDIKDFPPTAPPLDEDTYNQLIDIFKQGLLVDSQTRQPTPWLFMVFGLDNRDYNNWKLAGVLPYARTLAGEPLPGEFAVISDYVADNLHHLWDAFGVPLTNYHDGYINRDVLIQAVNRFSRFHPYRQILEDLQLQAYENVPYFDYDDHDIYLPAAAFLSPVTCPAKICLLDFIPNMTKSSDVTIYYLESYGHMDILFGTYSLPDVKEPLLQWLNNHNQEAARGIGDYKR